MKISRKRASELGLITNTEDCLFCEFCFDCHNTNNPDTITTILENGYECPAIDEERLRDEMTNAEYDAYRHGRLEIR